MNFLKTFLACLLAFFVVNFIMVIFVTMIFVGIAAGLSNHNTPVAVTPNSVLLVDFAENVTDSPDRTPFKSLGLGSVAVNRSNSILEVLSAIDAAVYNHNIKGIYLNITGGEISTANIEEVRAAIERFKQSGKFVIAYSENYSQMAYYIASVADRVYIHPEGDIRWQGLSSQVMFYKGLLDKLGVKVEILRHGTFKSAVEPFMLDRMSHENRMQLNTVLTSVWGSLLHDIGESRGIDPDALAYYASELKVRDPESALELGLVDNILYEDQVFDLLTRMTLNPTASIDKELLDVLESEAYYADAQAQSEPTAGEDEAEFDDESDDLAYERTPQADYSGGLWGGEQPSFIRLSDYIATLGATNARLGRADRIGIIYIDGDIIDGVGEPGSVGSADVMVRMAEARSDERIKGVVLRVNSPGGSALASDVMWREIELLRREKPVVVSMGGYAASGGYYVSCPADLILTDRTTLTGSIGVFGLMLNLEKTLKDNLGITVDVAGTGQHADLGSPFRPLRDDERDYLQEGVEKVYETFVGHVAAGRNMTAEQVDMIGQGRVWSGADAVEIGLADGVGGLWDAIGLCADRAGVSDYRVREIVDTPDALSTLLRSLTVSETKAKQNELGAAFVHYNSLMRMLNEQGVQARVPYMLEIR
ncbi:signal peptide peptidase SppA [Alistipes sp. OttesenSCG-928-B03]|nr:signal peptide peptidase SppA [Alistipes sp. OttesenSCG-928-B03]